eukprot:9204902-Heterocapsa_arctica.AAC.1
MLQPLPAGGGGGARAADNVTGGIAVKKVTKKPKLSFAERLAARAKGAGKGAGKGDAAGKGKGKGA